LAILWLDGFETIGDDTTADSVVQAALDLRYQSLKAGSPDDATLIDDFDADSAFALEMPATTVGQTLTLRMELPSAYQVTANASVGTFVIGARYLVPDVASDQNIFGFMTTSTSTPNALKIAANGVDLVLDDNDTTETISGVVTEGSWHYIEWEFKPTSGANGGYTKVYVDGSEVFSDTSRNVLQTFFSVWGFNIFGPASLDHTGNERVAFDDLCTLAIDGDNIAAFGPGVIRRHAVTADGMTTDWTPSTGIDNYALVDEIPKSESDYVSTSTDTDVDNYELSTALSVTGDILGVVLEAEAIEDTSGTHTLHVGLDDGMVEEDSGSVTTGSNSFVKCHHAKTPSGDSWTNTDFDATEARIRYEA